MLQVGATGIIQAIIEGRYISCAVYVALNESGREQCVYMQ
jgi:hypothetical protein